jgi:hypothetical protein
MIVQNRGGELRNAVLAATYVLAVVSLLAIVLFLAGAGSWVVGCSGTLGGTTVLVRIVRAVRRRGTPQLPPPDPVTG